MYRAAPTEPDYDQTRLSGIEIQQIEGHVRECPRCRLAVDSIIEEYNEVDIILTQAGIPPLAIAKPPLWAAVRDGLERAWSRAKRPRVPLPSLSAASVALGVLLLVLLWMGPWLRDPYHQLAFVEVTETSFLTRDAGSALTRGISLMNERRYNEALALLEPYSASESDPLLLDYAHYLSGLALVSEAKTEVFGRVLAFSASRLDRAIWHLQMVTESSQSERIREDAFWLLGKAHLMKREPDRALEAFRAMERLDGRRAGDARQLIDAVQGLEDD
jgi:tetratricopeptide (TPR) repeat protein